ncbi:MAG: aldo/keto reductase [Proteobacteria bacterium]|nr:aldo/keto reductase [Pseudomonadota bacterium]
MEWLDLKGVKMPALGLGTWPLTGEACTRAVIGALELGYRHIDTAESYGNEAAIGAALAAASVPRAELFLTTKLTRDHLGGSAVAPALAASLERLRTDYVDLLLIHWPRPDIPLAETLSAMASVQARGLVRRIGVSNFPAALMRDAVEFAKVPIACNQVEYHVLLSQRLVLAYARQHGIAVTAYSPLIQGQLTDHPVLGQIGSRHGKTPAQVALRWLIQQQGVAAVPKAASPENQRRNLDIFDFALDGDDLARLAALSGRKRLINPAWAPTWDPE